MEFVEHVKLITNYSFVFCLVLNCLRAEEDAWVFEDPVTESIAPGYFDVVNKPMDYSTIEKKIEANNYRNKEEVRLSRCQPKPVKL